MSTTELARVEAASLVEAPRPAPVRPRAQVIAAAILAGGSAMAIFALVGLYLSTRHGVLAGNGVWIPAGGLPLTGPNVALFTLLLSVPAMAWAQQAVANDDRQNLWVAIGIVLLLGAAFINAESFILHGMNLSPEASKSVGISDNLPMLLIFTIIGIHLLMVGAALVSILLTGFRTLGGQLSTRNRDGVSAVALYWYVTVGVFVVLWYAIYVTK
jgi:heme/copper-type cytochrome/quinol oxidase subunit 3